MPMPASMQVHMAMEMRLAGHGEHRRATAVVDTHKAVAQASQAWAPPLDQRLLWLQQSLAGPTALAHLAQHQVLQQKRARRSPRSCWMALALLLAATPSLA